MRRTGHDALAHVLGPPCLAGSLRFADLFTKNNRRRLLFSALFRDRRGDAIIIWKSEFGGSHIAFYILMAARTQVHQSLEDTPHSIMVMFGMAAIVGDYT